MRILVKNNLWNDNFLFCFSVCNKENMKKSFSEEKLQSENENKLIYFLSIIFTSQFTLSCIIQGGVFIIGEVWVSEFFFKSRAFSLLLDKTFPDGRSGM